MSSSGRKVIETLSSLAFIAAIAYGIVIGALYLFQRSLLYHPSDAIPLPAEAGIPEMRTVNLQTADGLELTSWYAPPADTNPVVVYFCGNAGHIGYRGFKARQLIDSGLGVLLVSYRGFGGNPGKPTEEGLFADGRAAMEFISATGIPPARIVLYGESLGTGVAVRMAWEQAEKAPVAAVVLETPYTSIAEVAQRHYPFVPARWLVKDRFDSLSLIDAIDAPVLMLHAEDDRVIPFEFAQELYQKAVEPKEKHWFSRGGHEGLFDTGAGDIVVEFIAKIAAGS